MPANFGTEGLAAGGLRNLRTGIEKPDSVVYQYAVSDFTTSTWTDSVGSADMTVNGLTAATFSTGEDSVSGDGVDDYGSADGPQTIAENETFGLAFTIQFSSPATNARMFGSIDGTSTCRLNVKTNDNGPQGSIEIAVQDDDGEVQVASDSAFDDGTPKAVVINKNGNSGADISIFVDDMTTAVASTVVTSSQFDHTSYTNNQPCAFYALNNDGTISLYQDMDAGIFEFNSAPYSQSERENFVSRRPEV